MAEDDDASEGAETLRPPAIKEFSREYFTRGADIVLSLINFPSWVHRKVDSVTFLAGKRGQRRVSLDCTPPMLSWDDDRRGRATTIVVPLTLMSKDVLRDLDVRDDSGRALPVLGTNDNAKLAATALAYLVRSVHDVKTAKAFMPQIEEVVRSRPETALPIAEAIITELALEVLAAGMFRDLASNFILATVLPVEASGVRTVLKYSSHWEAGMDLRSATWWERTVGRAWHRVLAGTGNASVRFRVNLFSVEYAESFHLEVNAPDGVLCSRIDMPEDNTGRRPADRSRTPVGHVNGHYDPFHRPETSATVHFALDHAGPLARTVVIAGAMAALFLVLLTWPGSFDDLTNGLDAATSLLLFVPALLIALNARAVESEFVRWFLLPLRVISGFQALVLVVAGGLLVLKFPEPIVMDFWWGSLIVSVLLLTITITGLIRLKVGARG